MPIATPEQLEVIAKLACLPDGVPATVLRHEPLGGPRGSKVLVVSRAPVTQIGSIIVPGQAQVLENDGWIVAVSRDVGSTPQHPLFTWVLDDKGDFAEPERAIGLHVTWGKFVGTSIPADPNNLMVLKDRFLLMVEGDLLSVIQQETTP